MTVVKRTRRCTECRQVFGSPDAYMSHKRLDGNCRTVEMLPAAGYVMTPKGWIKRVAIEKTRKK